MDQDKFLSLLMTTHWFKETVDLYFDGQYRARDDQIMQGFMRRRLVKELNGLLSTTVKP